MLAGCTWLCAPAAAAAQPEPIDWRVKDRFRLFDRASFEARQQVQSLLDTISPKGPENYKGFYFSYLRAISGSDGARAHSASLRTSNYSPANEAPDRSSGRYARDYLYPTHYSIEVRTLQAPADAECTYRSDLETRSGACGKWTSISVPRPPASAQEWIVDTSIAVTSPGRAAASQRIRFRDQLVVAFGDSYISGEGNPDVPSIITTRPDSVFERPSWGDRIDRSKHLLKEAEWWDEPCHRSLLSWPVIAGLIHAGTQPKGAVTLVHLGCSGAVIDEIRRHGETDLPGGGDERQSQMALLDELMHRPDESWPARKVDKTLLAIGGNDIGFAGVISALLLPPNGYFFGAPIARAVGNEAGAICPYRVSGWPLSRLCGNRPSAQERLQILPARYRNLRNAFLAQGIALSSVYQVEYPDALLDDHGQPCDTNPSNSVTPTGAPSHATGAEALMGVIKRLARGPLYRSWNFELMYLPETDDRIGSPLPNAPGCDDLAERGDSEVCQALWVQHQLNSAIRNLAEPTGATPYWKIVASHVPEIRKHGLCAQNRRFPLAMPLVKNGRWAGWSPQSVDPYAYDSPRWFRMPNDSIVTQYGFFNDERRFHHGTAHPTFRAHMEIAKSIYEKALAGSLTVPGQPDRVSTTMPTPSRKAG
jgi:hypothetical protein